MRSLSFGMPTKSQIQTIFEWKRGRNCTKVSLPSGKNLEFLQKKGGEIAYAFALERQKSCVIRENVFIIHQKGSKKHKRHKDEFSLSIILPVTQGNDLRHRGS